jgi:hypothetical protein
MRKPTQTIQPRYRSPKRQYFRQLIGGPLDGRTETVPMRSRATLRKEVNKSSWLTHPLREEPNIYRLTEPQSRPVSGATYLYEYQP